MREKGSTHNNSTRDTRRGEVHPKAVLADDTVLCKQVFCVVVRWELDCRALFVSATFWLGVLRSFRRRPSVCLPSLPLHSFRSIHSPHYHQLHSSSFPSASTLPVLPRRPFPLSVTRLAAPLVTFGPSWDVRLSSPPACQTFLHFDSFPQPPLNSFLLLAHSRSSHRVLTHTNCPQNSGRDALV